jgi:putative Mn2+ efflux pump MntP
MTIYLGLLHGLDNAAVALVLGPLLGWRRGLVLAAMFGACETLMPLAGAALPFAAFETGLAGLRTAVLAVAATTVAGLLLARRDPAALAASPAALAALALLLGLDNLVAGQGAGSLGAALATGAISGAVAAAACAAGAMAGRRLSAGAAARLSAGGLVLLASASAFA